MLATAGIALSVTAFAFDGGSAASAPRSQVQPGAFVRVGPHSCTLGFVFDGLGPQAGKEFIATASHCVDQIDQRALDEDGETFGYVAFIAPARSGPGGDFALIQVRRRWIEQVRPYLRGHSSFPKGATRPEETPDGATLQISGYGEGYADSARGREGRTGRLRFDDHWEFRAVGPVATGDSGAPLVALASGKALGMVADLCFGAQPGCDSARGPTVEGVLESARRSEFPLRLRRAGDPPTREVAATIPSPLQRLTALRVRHRAGGVVATFVLRKTGSVRLRIERRRGGQWPILATLRRRGRRGANSVRLPARLHGRRLRPGAYRLVAWPVSRTGRRGTARRAVFRLRG